MAGKDKAKLGFSWSAGRDMNTASQTADSRAIGDSLGDMFNSNTLNAPLIGNNGLSDIVWLVGGGVALLFVLSKIIKK